jgi:hypothetical protein
MAPLDNLLASNFVHHFSDPKLPAGKEGFKAIANMIFKAFPACDTRVHNCRWRSRRRTE